MAKKKSKSTFVNFLLVILLIVGVGVAAVLATGNQSLFGRAVVGRQFYVDSVSGNDSNSGTSTSSPWRSLNPVNAYSFTPGDTINFKRGSSFDTGLVISKSGTQSAPITFQAYGTGNAPIFSRPPEVRWGKGITVSPNTSWIVVDGLYARDAAEAGIKTERGSSNVTIRNFEATNVGMGVYIYGDNTKVYDSYVHDLKMIKNTQGGDDDFGGVAYWISAKNAEVAYSRCVNAIAPSYDYGMDGGCIEISSEGDYANVHHNYSINSAGFVEFGAEWENEVLDDVRIAYNVAIDNDESFFVAHLRGQSRFAVDLKKMVLENNTIVHRTKSNYAILQIDGIINPGSLIFRNNIVYSAIPVARRSDFIHTNNVYSMLSGASVGFALDSTEVQADPKFVSPGSNDFHLTAGSPAIDRASNVGQTLDYDRKVVPVNRLPDIGAYEYGASSDGVAGGGGGSVSTPKPATPGPTPTPRATTQPTVQPVVTPTPRPSIIPVQTPLPTTVPTSSGVKATYYSRSNFGGTQATRVEKTMSLFWNSSTDNSLSTNLSPQPFSIRWKGVITIPKTANYVFAIASDDVSTLTVNNLLVIQKPVTASVTSSKAYSFTAGERIQVEMTYSNGAGPAQAQLLWSIAGGSPNGVPSTVFSQ